MNWLLIAGSILAMTSPEDPEIHNVTLRGERVPANFVVCRSQWGTPMLPYGRTDGANITINQDVLDEMSALEKKQSEDKKRKKEISDIDDAIDRLEASLVEKRREAQNSEIELQSELAAKRKEIEEKNNEVAKQVGEFATPVDSAVETTRKDIERKLADLRSEEASIDAKLKSLKLSQNDPAQLQNDPMARELNRLKELSLRLKTSLGYSVTAPIDSFFIEGSILQPPKGSTASEFGLETTREFNRYDKSGDPRIPTNDITPFRPVRKKLAQL